MQSSVNGGRKRRVVRWIIVAFVVCALAEPVIMYKVLAHQKQLRSATSQSLSSTPTLNVTTGE
ncbi:MAG TPA: hypothetical protein VHE79_11715 [Spirochaetia bacterium]